MIPFDATEPTGNGIVDRIFQRLSNTLDSIAKLVTNDNLSVVTFAAASTDVTVRHGIKGPVRTFEVVFRDDDVQVWRSPTVNSRPRETIILQASAAATVTVRFT